MQEANIVEKKSKPLKRVWFVLLLLLPTILSFVLFYVIYNNVKDSSADIYHIRLTNFEGTVVAEERKLISDAQKDGIIALFFPITENLNTKAQIPEFIDRTRGFAATVDYMNEKNEYIFYFSVEHMVGYCIFKGESYKLADVDARKFLKSPFSQSLYDSAELPQLYTISGEPITPKTAWWSYAMASGDYTMARNLNLTGDIVVYDMSGALGLSFDRKPSECNITIVKDKKIVYEGGYEELSHLSFEKGDILRINIDANWLYGQSADCYGNISYSFDVKISDRADFYLIDDSYTVNSLCAIFCYNVKDASNIVFEATPALPTKPQFTISHGQGIALVPITKEMSTGEYKLTLTYGAATEEFVINITEGSELADIDIDVDQFTIQKAFDNAVLDDIETVRKFVLDNSNGEKLFSGEFLDYEALGATKRSGFGDVYNTPYKTYYSEGSEYVFVSQTDTRISALNSGKVIKTGYNAQLGNYVVVSHGCGLATWYAHLSTVDVVEGSYVVKGETLGKTGKTGLSDTKNVYILVTLWGELIDPAAVCGKAFDNRIDP